MSNQPPPPPPHGNQPHQPGPYGQQPYVAPAGQYDEPKKSIVPAILVGCLVTLGLCVVLCAGVGFWAYSSAKGFVADLSKQAVEAALEEAQLPPQEEAAILEQFERVSDGFETGDVTFEEVGKVIENVAKSDIVGLIALQAIETKYLNSSGLSDEEKSEAKRTIMRIVRGATEKKLDQEDIKKLTDHFLLEPDPSAEALPEDIGADDWKQSLTDDELRELLADAKALADEKEIPDEDFEVRISDILRDAIDDVLVK